MQYLKYIAIIGLVLYFLFDIWHIYCNVPKYLTLVYCFRNFFFTAIPMMFIGSTVVDRNSIRTKTIAVWLIFFSICAWVEMNSFHVNHIADVYFFTIPLSFFLFSLFVNCKIRKPNILTKCGEKYSLYIYITSNYNKAVNKRVWTRYLFCRYDVFYANLIGFSSICSFQK